MPAVVSAVADAGHHTYPMCTGNILKDLAASSKESKVPMTLVVADKADGYQATFAKVVGFVKAVAKGDKVPRG